jgi:CheY-like chemotaxis protein
MSDTTLRVLIVDDDALVRTALLQALIYAGYNVKSVDGGLAALAEIDREIPDLLLSDLNMPELSGLELLAEVRHRYPGIHVIAMSEAHFGESVPPGVFADTFYEKSRGVGP